MLTSSAYNWLNLFLKDVPLKYRLRLPTFSSKHLSDFEEVKAISMRILGAPNGSPLTIFR